MVFALSGRLDRCFFGEQSGFNRRCYNEYGKHQDCKTLIQTKEKQFSGMGWAVGEEDGWEDQYGVRY